MNEQVAEQKNENVPATETEHEFARAFAAADILCDHPDAKVQSLADRIGKSIAGIYKDRDDADTDRITALSHRYKIFFAAQLGLEIKSPLIVPNKQLILPPGNA